MNQQQHESVICRFIRGVPDALYDLGVGPKSEWQTLSHKYPKMRVFGCEPNPIMYDRLMQVKFPGPLAKVAVGENEGVATMHYATNDLKVASLFPVGYANATCEVRPAACRARTA